MLEFAPETKLLLSCFKIGLFSRAVKTQVAMDKLSLDAFRGRAACTLVQQAGGCLTVEQSHPVSPNGAYVGDHPWGLLVLVLPEVDLMRSCFNSCVCPLDELWMKQFGYE